MKQVINSNVGSDDEMALADILKDTSSDDDLSQFIP